MNRLNRAKEVNLVIHLIVATNIPLIGVEDTGTASGIVVDETGKFSRETVRLIRLEQSEKILGLRRYLSGRNHVAGIGYAIGLINDARRPQGRAVLTEVTTGNAAWADLLSEASCDHLGGWHRLEAR